MCGSQGEGLKFEWQEAAGFAGKERTGGHP
jgi:hypothetical protein